MMIMILFTLPLMGVPQRVTLPPAQM